MAWKSRAAVYVEKDVLEFQEITIEDLKPDEVLLKVLLCGVCGTDLHLFHGEVPLAKPPVVLGHEIVAEVVELGDAVEDLKPGQRVAVDPVVPCGHCEFCQSGRPNLCPNMKNMGYHMTGGYTQYTVASRDRLFPLRDDMPLKAGALVEPLACVVRGYERLQPLPGSKVLILGAGPIGLLWNQMLQGVEAAEITQVDVVPERAEVAGELGARHALAVERGKIAAAVRDVSPDGFDVVVDATGDPDAVQEGVDLVRPGGKLMLFGVSPEDGRVVISPYQIFLKELTILGAKMPPLTFPAAVRILESGKIDAETIVSHVLPLADLPEAFEMFEKGKDKVLKMAIDPWM